MIFCKIEYLSWLQKKKQHFLIELYVHYFSTIKHLGFGNMSISAKQELIRENNKNAIVIGASFTGLLAARVLLKHFEKVTIIERDLLSDKPQIRSGVPQSMHVHALLTRGERILEKLFPGIGIQLSEAGAPTVDWVKDWSIFGPLGQAPRFDSGLVGHAVSRVLLEWLIRNRLAEYDNLQILDQSQLIEFLANKDKSKITGVKIRSRTEVGQQTDYQLRELDADLVVDTTGRKSSLPERLKALGYQAPQKSVVNPFISYATRWYQCPDNFQLDWRGLSLLHHPMDSNRLGNIYSIEGNRWIVTLGGIGKDQPPNDEEGFLEFARNMRNTTIYDAIKEAKPLTPVYSYRKIENRLYHYEKLSRFPEGLLVLGDAVCALNPTFAQGMTLAGLGALTLDECLHQQFSNGSRNVNGLGKKFQKKLAKINRISWIMVTGEDLRWSTTEGGKLNLFARLMHRYIDAVMTLAFNDENMFRILMEVDHKVKPIMAMFHPNISLRVLRQLLTIKQFSKQLSKEQLAEVKL